MLGRRFFSLPFIHFKRQRVLRLVERNQPKYKQVIKPLQIIALSVNKSPVSVAFHPVGFALLFVCVCASSNCFFRRHQPHGIDKYQILFTVYLMAWPFFRVLLFFHIVCLLNISWEQVFDLDGRKNIYFDDRLEFAQCRLYEALHRVV